MEFIADFHIHSHYSRATSKDCGPEMLDFWARRKGIDVQGSGDFTHYAWRQELEEKLVMGDGGLYVLKDEFIEKTARRDRTVRFVISGEISSIYKKNGKTRKVHNVIVLPDLEAAHRLSKRLEAIGNLHSDGRPILGLDSKTLLEITLDVCPLALFIPAHIWTPHFSVFGSNSGFDHIEECFEDLTDHIFALETGLSSDPPMNWRLSSLDRFALVSNSDAHSPGNLAREANIFNTDLSYQAIYSALQKNDRKAFSGTIEFFPEEGKYHFDGHRACKIQWEPSRTIAASGLCPVCGKKLTVGVLHRVTELADREEHYVPPDARGFERIVPLTQIIGSSIGSPANSVKVSACYQAIIDKLGPELVVLREIAIDGIKAAAGDLIAEGVRRMRAGELHISAGYDGEYGVVDIFTEQERSSFLGQSDIFGFSAPGRRKTKREEGKQDKRSVKKKESNSENEKLKSNADNPYGLNKLQWEAASSSGKAVMVIAGPGTGKTRTLVSRVEYLVSEQKADPSSIAAITFTNKAAAEMRARLARSLKKTVAEALTIGTFHRICLDLLKNNDVKDSFSIVDQATARAIFNESLEIHANNIPASEAIRRISLAKAKGSAGISALDGAIKSVFEEYQSRLKRLKAMDFDDILLNSLEAFQRNLIPPSLSAGRWMHLLVDEFQDINEIQFSLIKEWGREAKSIFIIGDPHQSIYGFRGASPGYFDAFQNEFPDAVRVTLSENYRNPLAVAAAGRLVITGSADGAEPNSPTPRAISGNDAHALRLVEVKDEFSEALFITKEINRMMGGVDMLDAHVLGAGSRGQTPGNRSFSDFAVLYRTHRQASVIERCFAREGIQFKVAGRGEFLDDPIVRQAIVFFKFLVNPNDFCSLSQCLSGLGVDRVHEILEGYMNGSREISALQTIAANDARFLAEQEGIARLVEQSSYFKPRIDGEKPAGVIKDFMAAQGVAEDQQAFLIVHLAEMHDTMQSFLYALTMGQDADILRNGKKTVSPDAVTLLTLHAAKGLEFPVVFLCGVNEGVIPLQGPSGTEIDIDEERRLFYVGLTRTREELICTLTRRRTIFGATQQVLPSRFVRDMGEKNYVREKIRLEPEARQMSFL